eukprot:3248337-Amphidinium_carterae.1
MRFKVATPVSTRWLRTAGMTLAESPISWPNVLMRRLCGKFCPPTPTERGTACPAVKVSDFLVFKHHKFSFSQVTLACQESNKASRENPHKSRSSTKVCKLTCGRSTVLHQSCVKPKADKTERIQP